MQRIIGISIVVALNLLSVHAQNRAYLELSSNLKVQLIVVDPGGLRTGADPRGIPADTVFKVTWLKDIPGADYSFSSEENISDSTDPEWIENTLFTYSPELPDSACVYMVQVIGVDTGSYWIGSFLHRYVDDSSRSWGLHGSGVIEKDSVVTYQLRLCGLANWEPTLTKVVNPRSLNRDIAAMRKLKWIKTQSAADLYADLISNVSTRLSSGDQQGARAALNSMLQHVVLDSGSTVSIDACNLIRPDVENLLTQIPSIAFGGLNVRLINSTGTNLSGGSLQYYDGSWKNATNNNDGTFSITTSLKTLSLRMTYEGGSQTKSNVTVGPDVVTFQTVNAQVKLQSSQSALMDTGSVQYYAGSWRSFGSTANGTASKELLPGSYTFRMTYAGGVKDLQQNIGNNPVVVFQTVNATVQLKNSQGASIDQGTVQYYAGAWRPFGATSSGSVSKELLPISYSFRMTNEGVSNDKTQDISANSTLSFSTVLCTVGVKNSQAQPVNNAMISYYSGAWRQIGQTVNGQVTKELLPANLTFRMVLGPASQDKAQNIGTSSLVEFVVQ